MIARGPAFLLPMSLRHGPTLGAWLGLANTATIALGIGLVNGHGESIGGMFLLVFVYGALPAFAAGLALGDLARRTSRMRSGRRGSLLVILAFAVVFLLGFAFDYLAIAPLACIPTLVCALLT